jgi:flagellar biosynthesis protein FlhG
MCPGSSPSQTVESIQAEQLRRAIAGGSPGAGASRLRKTVAVVSGKGGVGKSHFALNLALTLGDRLKIPSALLDADFGLANADVLIGLDARLTLANVFRGELPLKEILVPVSDRVWLVPGGSGIADLAEMDAKCVARLLPELSCLDDLAEVLVIDAGAGIQSAVREISVASDAIVLMTTPEPTALKDAYGMLKSLVQSYGTKRLAEKELFVFINMAFSEIEAREAAARMLTVSRKFLGLELKELGYLPHDVRVSRAVKAKCPLVRLYPHSELAGRIERAARRVLASPAAEQGAGIEGASGKTGAWRRFLQVFLAGRERRESGR